MRAMLWMLGSIASFCLMAVAARELDGHIDKFELLAIRSAVGIIILVIIMNVIKRPTLMYTKRMNTHLLRNIFHFIGQFSWLVGIGLLPLAQVFAIEFTVPLWVLIMASLFLGETITRRKVVSVALGLAGVVVILKPGMQMLDTGAIVMLIAALCFAVTFIVSKSLLTTEHPLTVVFYMTLIQLPLSALMAGADWTMPQPWMWPWVMAVSLTGLFGHYCLSKSFQQADVSVVISVDFLRLPVIAIIGMWIYNEPLEVSVILGGVLMLLANLANQWRIKPPTPL
ncbi:MAG: DMT family transporter [Oceanospirillaceae bacterium]|nr:DMT family transporter [Oceanospirillaceae bacterium]